jgi:molybdopterin converting factor small subunit
MIKVRVFGVMRLVLKVGYLEIAEEEVEAGAIRTVEAVLKKISTSYEGTSLKELKGCIIFVNGTNVVDLKRFRTKIKAGDEIQIFSPMGGG